MRIRAMAGTDANLCACEHGFGPASPLHIVKGALTSEAVKAEAMMSLAAFSLRKL